MQPAFSAAVDYLLQRGHIVPTEVLAIAKSRAIKQAGSYQAIRNDFWARVYDAVYDLLSKAGIARTGPETRMRIAISEDYQEAAYIAYEDGGGTPPLDDDTAAYVSSATAEQLAYSEQLFQNLIDMRKEGDFDPIAEAFRRADGYTNSLDILYNTVKSRGAKNKMLTFGGPDGRESCADCQHYKGQRHRASWWVSHNAVPPNRDFECHGYRCEHRLFDDEGNEFTI